MIRQQAFVNVSGRCMQVGTEIIRQARSAGDLADDSPSDEHILSGLVSLAKGAHLLGTGDSSCPASMGLPALELLNDNFQIFLDGAKWTPLRSEWDYKASEQRILEQSFDAESKHCAEA